MSCKDCGNKTSRHLAQSGDVDREPAVPPPGPAAPDPFSDFVAAKNASYDELKERQRMQQEMIASQHNFMLGEMTPAMKRKFIEDLVGVANAEMDFPGMAPEQAVVAVKKALDRDDFSFITVLYPNLKPAVDTRYLDIVSKALPLN